MLNQAEEIGILDLCLLILLLALSVMLLKYVIRASGKRTKVDRDRSENESK